MPKGTGQTKPSIPPVTASETEKAGNESKRKTDALWEGFLEEPERPSARAVPGPRVRIEKQPGNDVWTGPLQADYDFTVPSERSLPFEALPSTKPDAEPATSAAADAEEWPGSAGDDLYEGDDAEPYFSVPIADEMPTPEPDPTLETAVPILDEASAAAATPLPEAKPPAHTRAWFWIVWSAAVFGGGVLFALYVLPRLASLISSLPTH